MQLLERSWRRAWRAMGAPDGDGALLQELLGRYAQPHRRYHTLQHLGECISTLTQAYEFAVRPGEVEVALWFHDAIYYIGRDDNELRSAVLAKGAVLAAGAGPDAAGRVHALVMSTRHEAPAQGLDNQLLVDVDLSILGAPAGRFDEYESQVRQEYASVPEEQFAARRCAILRRFLARPAIYGTAYFRDGLEASARENLLRSLSKLGA